MWKTVKLGELYDVASSKRVLKADWKNFGVPFYRGREITSLSKDGFVNNELFITEEHYQSLAKKYGVPKAGDIMITAIGTIGNTYIVDDDDRFYFKDASVLWLKKKSEVLSKFVQYWLRSTDFFEQLDKGNGATVDTLTIQKLASLSFKLPPLAEQQRIVEKLDRAFAEIDKAVSTNTDKLYTLRNLISKIQNSLFNLASTQMMRLEDVAIFENGDRGKNYPSKKYQISEGIPFVNAGDFSAAGDIKNEGLVYISEERFNLLGAGKFRINDVLLCLRGSLGKSAINKKLDVGAIASSLVILRAKEEVITADYLFAFIRSDAVMQYIKDTAGGAAQPNLSARTVGNYLIPVPTIEEQKSIADSFWRIRDKGLAMEELCNRKNMQLVSLKMSILKQALQPQQQ